MIFKKKRLTLHAYAPVGQLVDLFPPVKLSDSHPDWYKVLPADVGEHGLGLTVKHCSGLKDLYSAGMLMPLWADHEIATSPTNPPWIKTNYNPPNGPAHVSHNLDVQATNAWPGYSNIKFSSPWMFWCDEPVQWLISQPTWHQKDPSQIQTVTGIFEFRHQHQTNISVLIKNNAAIGKPITLRAGTPMAYITPLIERDWDLKVDVWDPTTFAKRFARWDFTLSNGSLHYQRVRNIIIRKK